MERMSRLKYRSVKVPCQTRSFVRKEVEGVVGIALNDLQPAIGHTITVDKRAGDSKKKVLTAREIEVLRLLADGLTTKAAAVRLGVSFKTAACHRSRILQKLDVDTIVLAVRWAIREGIVEV